MTGARRARERLSPLAPLPPLARGVVDELGSPFLPGLEVHVPREISRGERDAALAALWKTRMAGIHVQVLVHGRDSWPRSEGDASATASSRFAVVTRPLLVGARVDSLAAIDAVATFLARRLGGVVVGTLRRDVLVPRFEAIAAAEEAHGRYRLFVELDDDPDVVAFRDALLRLGIVRGDFGNYAWNNPHRALGPDRLLILDCGLDLDLPEPGWVTDVTVNVDLAHVPLPEIVVARAFDVTDALIAAFGGRVVGHDRHGRRFEIDRTDPSIERRIAALRAVGFHRDVRRA